MPLLDSAGQSKARTRHRSRCRLLPSVYSTTGFRAWLKGLFGVEDHIEQEQADGGEDDVVAEEELDPEGGVAVAGEDDVWPGPWPAGLE